MCVCVLDIRGVCVYTVWSRLPIGGLGESRDRDGNRARAGEREGGKKR